MMSPLQAFATFVLLTSGAEAAGQGLFAALRSEGSVRPFEPLMRRHKQASPMVEAHVKPSDQASSMMEARIHSTPDEETDDWGEQDGFDEDQSPESIQNPDEQDMSDENAASDGQDMSDAETMEPTSTDEDEVATQADEQNMSGGETEMPGSTEENTQQDEQDVSDDQQDVSSSPANDMVDGDVDADAESSDAKDNDSSSTNAGEETLPTAGTPSMDMPEATAKIAAMSEKSKHVSQALTKAEEASKEAHAKAVQYQEAMKALNKETNTMITEAINLRKTFHGEMKTQVETLSQHFKTTADDIENADKAEHQTTGNSLIEDDHHTHKKAAHSKLESKAAQSHTKRSGSHHTTLAKPKAAQDAKNEKKVTANSKHSRPHGKGHH